LGPGLLLPGPILVSLIVAKMATIVSFLLTYAELPENVETLGSTVLELV